MGFESDVAHGGRQALAMVSRESFDAVLLDLRCYDVHAEEVVNKIREIRPSLLGRVLVIIGEVADQRTLKFIERHSLPHISQGVMEEMRKGLRAALG
jgi:DNA-binding response OmpR family regulator